MTRRLPAPLWDMDFVQARAAAAREIALAFGVPPMLLGLPGDNTFANYAEANRGFWRQTVLPLVGRTAQSLAHWLGPAWEGGWEGASSIPFGHTFSPRGGEKGGRGGLVSPSPRWREDGAPATRGQMRGAGADGGFGGSAGPLRLVPDLDRIDALASERSDLWSRIGAAGFLTDDEKRAAVGYGARDGGQGEGQGEGKGGWAGLDAAPGDRVASPGGIGTTFYGGGTFGAGTFGAGTFGGGGDGHWVNQPRVPAGNPDGGQWTAEGGVISGGGGGDVGRGGVGDDDLTTGSGRKKDGVDLATEDVTNPGRRSHPAAKHVGMTREQIAATIESESVGLIWKDHPVVGSFRDMRSANRYVNEALAENSDIVDKVRKGDFGNRGVKIIHFFNEVTGFEGFKIPGMPVRFRANTGIFVYIQKDGSERGFRLITAYPLNKNPVGRRDP